MKSDIPVIAEPLYVAARDGEVVIISRREGTIAAALTPEAVVASLEPLRRAADEAFVQRRAANASNDDDPESASTRP
jgi:hypothetical protein